MRAKNHLFLLLLFFFLIPAKASAQPAVTFQFGYLNQATSYGNFSNIINLDLYFLNGEHYYLTQNADTLRINGVVYQTAKEACQALTGAAAIQFATDENGLFQIDFTPRQTSYQNVTYDEQRGCFSEPNISSELPVYYIPETGPSEQLVITPYLKSGYLYHLDVYGDGIVITQMQTESGQVFIEDISVSVLEQFEQKTIEVTPLLSQPSSSFTVSVSSDSGFQAFQPAEGTDTVSILYDKNQDDTLHITVTLENGNSRQKDVKIAHTPIHTAYVGNIAESGDTFDFTTIAIQLYAADGTMEIYQADENTVINQMQYETAEELTNALEDAVIIEYISTQPGYLDNIRFTASLPVSYQDVSYDVSEQCFSNPAIPKGLSVFYPTSQDPLRFIEAYLQAGYTYDLDVYSCGIVIRNIEYPGKSTIIKNPFITVFNLLESKSISVNPVFSAGDIPYTAELLDEGNIRDVKTGTGELVFEGLPNQTHSYTVRLSSAESDTREFTVDTLKSTAETAYLNRYSADGWNSYVLELFDAETKELLTITRDTIVNHQPYSEWEYTLEDDLRQVKFVQFIRGADATIQTLQFNAQQPIIYEAVRYNSADAKFSHEEIPAGLPVFHIYDAQEPKQARAEKPFLKEGYSYQLAVYPEAILILDISNPQGTNIIQDLNITVIPGFYEQSIQVSAEFKNPIDSYTVQLLEGNQLLEEQNTMQNNSVLFEHVPNETHQYTIRIFAPGSDTREETVTIQQAISKYALLSTTAKTTDALTGNIQIFAAILENGVLHSYPFSPEATLPDGTPVTDIQIARKNSNTIIQQAKNKLPVTYTLNDKNEISRMRYTQPAVITDCQNTNGRWQISYVLTMYNADIETQTTVTPCAAIYQSEQLIAVRTFQAVPVGEDCVVSDTVTLDIPLSEEQPLTVRPFWWDSFSSMYPLTTRF